MAKNTELAPPASAELAPPASAAASALGHTIAWNRDQLDLIKRTVCRDSTDDELQLFLYTAKRTGLDPLASQIYAIKRYDSRQRREVMKIQTGIDGYRVVAQRSGEYEGQTSPQWCGEDGVWKDIWTSKQPPFAARVGVWRKGFREPLYGLAQWSFYVQTDRDGNAAAMWARGGPHMLAKCAEALGLKKAFPNDLSGLYTTEEMMQSEQAESDSPTPAERPREVVANTAEESNHPAGSQPSSSGSDPKPQIVKLSGNGEGERMVAEVKHIKSSPAGIKDPWELYSVVLQQGGYRVELTTLSASVVQGAKLAHAHNKPAMCKWELKDGKYQNLLECVPVGVPVPVELPNRNAPQTSTRSKSIKDIVGSKDNPKT